MPMAVLNGYFLNTRDVNPSREVTSILSGKHKRFTFVHPVEYNDNLPQWKRRECNKGISPTH